MSRKRMTWKEIQKVYPDRWLGLDDVQYINNDGISVESAVVKYDDKSKDELTRLMLKGDAVAIFTTPDRHLQLGAVEVLG